MFLEDEPLRRVLQHYLPGEPHAERSVLSTFGVSSALGKPTPGLRLGGGRGPVSSTGTVLGARIGLSACFMSVSFNMEMLPWATVMPLTAEVSVTQPIARGHHPAFVIREGIFPAWLFLLDFLPPSSLSHLTPLHDLLSPEGPRVVLWGECMGVSMG